MSIAIWPPVSAEECRFQVAEALASLPTVRARARARGPRCADAPFFLKQRELEWITAETIEACRELKHGLDDCYALVAPVDPGSTLVMSTPRNERVKGTITRVGSRIVKGVRPRPSLPRHVFLVAWRPFPSTPPPPSPSPPGNR